MFFPLACLPLSESFNVVWGYSFASKEIFVAGRMWMPFALATRREALMHLLKNIEKHFSFTALGIIAAEGKFLQMMGLLREEQQLSIIGDRPYRGEEI